MQAPSATGLAEQLRQALRETRSTRLSGLPDLAVAWLAMSPGWPRSLAAAGFPDAREPMRGEAAEQVLQSLVDAGMAEVHRGEPPWADPWYVMNRQQRAIAAAELAARHVSDGEYFLRALNDAAHAMCRAMGDQRSPPPLARWMELGTAGPVDAIADVLDARVREAVDQARERRQTACPDALRWIETAEPLAEILAANLEVAVARSRRRLELFHRQTRDERLLDNYVPRREQEQAFLDLIRDDSPAWALHFIGYAGAGKTMLMRRIKTEFARRHNLATARIDFDNLNPNYPARAPGLLLMGFAEELRLTDSATAFDRFRKFDLAIRAVHEKLESAFRSGSRTGTGGAARLEMNYADAEKAFVDALARIAEISMPVLILDTCEELAKARTDTKLPEALLTTFEILERLHSVVPKVRVVLSGRRMLAGVGCGWELPGLALPKRDYLRLVELRGFDRREADEFLNQYQQGERRVPIGLREPILAQSLPIVAQSLARERSIVENVVWDPPREEAGADEHYNPFDVDLFASLACGEKPPTPEQMAKGTETFVRERIANRLSVDTGEILVELAILGRFDRELLEAFIGRQGAAFDAIWDDLKEQEWSDVDRSAREGAEIWGMQPHLRERVCRFFRTNAVAWHAARQRLRPLLWRITAERPWKALIPSYFVVALDVLSDEPEEAARWWTGIERRLAMDGVWDWARDITALVVDIEDPARINQSGMRAAVFATRAAAMLRLGPGELSYLWGEVLAGADRHPVAEGRPVLRYRALAGIVTDLRFRPDRVSELNVPEFESVVGRVPPLEALPVTAQSDPEVLASELALVESCAEILARIDWQRTPPGSMLTMVRGRARELIRRQLPPSFRGGRTRRSAWSRTYTEVLDARFQALEGAAGALDVSWREDLPPADTDYLDWLRPQDLPARMRLEMACLNRWHLDPVISEIPRLKSLDDDRYHAIRLMAAGDRGLVELDFGPAVEASLELSRRDPECVAHAAVPPFFAVALEMRAAAGDFQGALAELQTISSNGNAPVDLRQAAERAAIRVITRFRLLDTLGAIGGVLEQSSKLSDAVSAAGMNAFSPIRSRLPYLGRWREAIDWLKGKGQDPRIEPSADADASFAEFSLALDWAEDTAPGDKFPLDLSEATLVRWERQHPRAWVERTILRARLGPEPEDDLGPRWIAEILFEEGSLLALRQPERGARVLEIAAGFYGRVQDIMGQRLSTIAAALAWARARNRKRLRQVLDAPVLDVAEPDVVLGSPWGMRLRFARSRAAEFDVPGPLTLDLLKGEDLQTYAANGLALDLQGVMAHESLGAAVQAGARARRRKNVGYVALGAAAFTVATFLLVRGVQWTAGWFGYSPSAVEILVSAVAAAVFLIALIVGISEALLPDLIRIKIQVEPAGAVPDPNRPLREARTWITRVWEFVSPISGPRTHIELPATDAETYAAQSAALLQRKPKRAVIGVQIAVHLVVDPRCAAACWEAILGLGGGLLTEIGQSPFQYRRTGLSADANATSRLDNPVHVQLWALGYGSYSRQLWAMLGGRRRQPYRVGVRSSADLSDIDRADVLHIICEAVEGAGGLELRISKDAASDLETDAASDLETVSSKTLGAPSGFSPRAIARRRAGPPRLCVLQGFALPEPRRFPTDRYGAGLMRRAAAEIFDAGVPAVVVIPSVPEPIAMKVVEPIVRAIARRPRRGAEELLRAVRRIQSIIVAEASSDRATAMEIAFDVCLYCVSRLNLQVNNAVTRPEVGDHGPAEMA